MREREGVVVSLEVDLVLPSVVVLIVAHVLATSAPAELLRLSLQNGLLLLLVRVDQDLHALVVETLGFDHVEHIEFDLHSFPDVAHSEEEPLGVSFGVHIILQDEVVLVVADFVRQLEVSRLESRLKNESLILDILWCVVVERWEREWLSVSLVLVIARNTYAILRLEEFLKVAGPYQLVEIVCIKLLV